MKDILKVLRLGVTKGDYPVYGQYLHSTGKQLQTYNKSILVCIDHKAQFTGSTNFFVIENLLSNLDTYDIKQEASHIIITSDTLKSDLMIDDVGFPKIKNHSYKKGLFITEELLYILSTAIKFTGDNYYKYVVITNKGIIATDTQRAFCYDKEIDVESDIFVDKIVISMLKVGHEINFDNNIFVKFDDGYIIFETDDVSGYDVDHIYNQVLNYSDSIVKLCNIQVLRDAIHKTSHVLYNENQKIINIFNKKKVLTVTAECYTNGVSSMEYKSELDNMYEGNFDMDKFDNLSLDYDVYVNLDNNKYLYLIGDDSEILIIGVTKY